MKVAIICESVFGNTEVLPHAVRGALAGEGASAVVVEVAAAQTISTSTTCSFSRRRPLGRPLGRPRRSWRHSR